jgi:hypothetical protein
VTTKKAEVMSMAMIALVNKNESTVECLGAADGDTGYKELKNAVEAVMVYMLEKTMQNCTNCEKRMASACSWNFISINVPLSELLTLAFSSNGRKLASVSL